MNAVTAAIFGLIFGAGLVISGMTDPNRILAFLDVAGDWDPSLALVMAGAIAIALPAYALARRAQTTVLGEALYLPDRRRPITSRLVAGAALFGVGWGLSGLCPGPAIVLLSAAQLKAILFFAAVAAGTWAAMLISAKRPLSAARPGKPAEPVQQAINEQEPTRSGVDLKRQLAEQKA
jgi:uncharacterized membrane protein YedE/YeeE